MAIPAILSSESSDHHLFFIFFVLFSNTKRNLALKHANLSLPMVRPRLLLRPPNAAAPPSSLMLLHPSPPPPNPIRKSTTFPPRLPVAPLRDGAAPARTRAPPVPIACMAPSSPFASSGGCVGPPKRSIPEWVSGFFGNDEFLQCGGGIGMALLSTTTSMAKSRISPFLAALAANPTFVSGLLAWALAQSMKLFLNFFVERKWEFGVLVSSGGMPSSHSALCTALTTSVAFCHGVADSLFPVCLGFSLIVMYDATGVRRHAGMQAEVLNVIIEDLFQGHPISQRKLKELLGHTPSQVLAGAVLGVLVACFCCQGGTLVI